MSAQEKCDTAINNAVPPADVSHNEIIRPKFLPQVLGISRTGCWRLEKAGDFPKKIRLSKGCVGYRRVELEAWLESRQAA